MPDFIDKHIGSRIKIRRNVVGLTQSQLAKAVGVTFQQVQKYERASNRVPASRLFRIAIALGVSPIFFFEGIKDDNTNDDALYENLDDGSMPSKGTIRLLRAFRKIKDAESRQALVAVVESMKPNDT